MLDIALLTFDVSSVRVAAARSVVMYGNTLRAMAV